MKDDNYGVSPGGWCEKCGATLFNIIPGKTTQQEIIEFARAAVGWQENPDALDGWMPPGIYCPNGCVAIHADYPPPWPPETTETIDEPGPRRFNDIFWNGIVIAVFLGLVAGAVYLFRPHIKWLRVAANILVLIFGTAVIGIFGQWLENGPYSEEREFYFQLPFFSIFIFTVVGGVLTLFFGWYSTLAILGGYTCLAVIAGLISRANPD